MQIVLRLIQYASAYPPSALNVPRGYGQRQREWASVARGSRTWRFASKTGNTREDDAGSGQRVSRFEPSTNYIVLGLTRRHNRKVPVMMILSFTEFKKHILQKVTNHWWIVPFKVRLTSD